MNGSRAFQKHACNVRDYYKDRTDRHLLSRFEARLPEIDAAKRNELRPQPVPSTRKIRRTLSLTQT